MFLESFKKEEHFSDIVTVQAPVPDYQKDKLVVLACRRMSRYLILRVSNSKSTTGM
jgi:hypothetical protein